MANKKETNKIHDLEVTTTVSVDLMIEHLNGCGLEVYSPFPEGKDTEAPTNGAKTKGMLCAERMVKMIRKTEDEGQQNVLRDFITSYLNIGFMSDKEVILQALAEIL